jgi:subtilisin family serine protease
MLSALIALSFASLAPGVHASEPIKIIIARNLKGERIGRNRRDPHPMPKVPLWSQLDSTTDHFEGTSTAKVYEEFKIPKRKNVVIVAVIDSGVDIHHKDLIGKIWVNPGEIAGDGLDNDGDGYVDDINGWNFIGNVDGSTLESTRELARLNKRKKQLGALSAEETEYYERLMKDYSEKRFDTEETIESYQEYADAFSILQKHGFKIETVQGLDAVTDSDIDIQNAKTLVRYLLKHDVDSKIVETVLTEKKRELDFAFNFDFIEKSYGNNDVIGPNPEHGTHVAGIIAANRTNDIGTQGQALDVRIMPLRVIPDGDERDKDVADAIRFAVDHKARIINMSFGKPFSPDKEEVDEAVRYAESHNVLIVHSAGNDGISNDSYDKQFPNKKMLSGDEDFASNWIEVGASNMHAVMDPTTGDSLIARFSNWGKNSVDLFAPGVQIVSTVPGDQYESLQGTSMAAPQVSGIAALILELHPQLTAVQLKAALMNTVTQYPDLQVYAPGTIRKVSAKGTPAQYEGDHVLFSDLSVSGGVVNAYNAIVSLESFFDRSHTFQSIKNFFHRF